MAGRPLPGYRDRGQRRPPSRGEKPRPTPLPDGRCNPLCPYFRCLNNALIAMRKVAHGRIQRVPMCRWIGDQCIGGTCQYASCTAKALLPEGYCLYAKEKKAKRAEEEEKEIERELVKEEEEMSRLERLMRKRGYAIDADLL